MTNTNIGHIAPAERVQDLLKIYGAADACAAELLCDMHDPQARAYRVLGSDLTPYDLTYGELRRDSERFAAALASMGIGPGDRVATLMGKGREYLVALMGIWRLGAVHVPLFTAFAPPAITFRILSSGAKAVVCDGPQRAKLAAGDDVPAASAWRIIVVGEADDGAASFQHLIDAHQHGIAAARLGGDAPIIHIYTSGTTGDPKGVVVPMRALAAFRIYGEYGQGLRPDDVFWCGADPGWAYGLYFGVLTTFTTATPSILLASGFTPESTLQVLEREGVTNFAAAPTVYRSLRLSDMRPSGPLALRRLSSAGEPLTPEVNSWAKEVFGLAVHDHYGQTEAGMLINNHHHVAVAQPIIEGSMGQAMPGWKAVVLDPIEDREVPANTLGRVAMVVAQSPLAWFRGYDGDPGKQGGKFTSDGRYYLTGDSGSIDERGYFHFAARDDDVIIMAGYRIGPFEVESSIATHPAVAETAVIATPDEVRGEVIEAFVVLGAGQEPSAELARDIQQWVKTRYAAHAYPRTVHFIDAMPKTPSGKIQRFVLKQRRLGELGVPS